MNQESKKVFLEGMRDGIPIGLGYLAVGFSLGVFARNVGVTPLQALVSSLLTHASAGQYATYSLIGAGAAIIEIIFVAFIANARYMLMSASMAQRLSPNMPYYHRFILGNYVTDEIFGITIARPGVIDPIYTYGAVVLASPMWATGVTTGVVAGNLLPANVTNALSVALYGMFIAIIIPAAKKDKIVGLAIIISFVLSYLFTKLPVISNFSEGTRTIILTVCIASLAAILFPIKEDQEEAAIESEEVTPSE